MEIETQNESNENRKEKGGRRWKNIGLGYKTPEAAKNGTYFDKKCPFTGNISIRKRFLKGEVIKMKHERSIVIRIDYTVRLKKYKRYKRCHKNHTVHMSPCFLGLIHVGDTVICHETRKLSKTISHVVVDYIPAKHVTKEQLKTTSAD